MRTVSSLRKTNTSSCQTQQKTPGDCCGRCHGNNGTSVLSWVTRCYSNNLTGFRACKLNKPARHMHTTNAQSLITSAGLRSGRSHASASSSNKFCAMVC